MKMVVVQAKQAFHDALASFAARICGRPWSSCLNAINHTNDCDSRHSRRVVENALFQLHFGSHSLSPFLLEFCHFGWLAGSSRKSGSGSCALASAVALSNDRANWFFSSSATYDTTLLCSSSANPLTERPSQAVSHCQHGERILAARDRAWRLQPRRLPQLALPQPRTFHIAASQSTSWATSNTARHSSR